MTSGGYTIPYKFTGKELDKETGLYYFGARYYDARVGRWVSADPALGEDKYFPKSNDFDTEHDFYWYISNDSSGKLPGMGGVFNAVNIDVYHYAGQNPVKLVDPDGEIIVIEGDPEFKEKVQKHLEQLKKDDPQVKKVVEDLERSKNVHTIIKTDTKKNYNEPNDSNSDKEGKPTGSTTCYNPDSHEREDGAKRHPRVGLAHELQHAHDSDKGTSDYKEYGKKGNKIRGYEIKAVNFENLVRKKTGDPKRTDYSGRPIPKDMLK